MKFVKEKYGIEMELDATQAQLQYTAAPDFVKNGVQRGAACCIINMLKEKINA